MSFPFDTTLPATSPSADYSTMQINNNSTYDLINVDHQPFGISTGGKHKKTTYVTTTDPASLAGEYVAYAKADPVSGATEIFFRKDAAATITQLTRGVPAYAGVAGALGSGSVSFLPGGLLIQCGMLTTVPAPTIIQFPTAFTTAVYSVVCTPVGGTASIRITGLASLTQFTVSAISSSQIYWMAIGV